MTRIWLSQRLAGGRDEVAALLGPDASVAAGGPFPPAGTDLSVASCFEHALLDALAARPAGLAPGTLVAVAPPGIPVTDELRRARAEVFATATTPAEIAGVVRATLSACGPGSAPAAAAWPAPAPVAAVAAVAAPAPAPDPPWRGHLVAKVLAAAALVVALGAGLAVALPEAAPASPNLAGAGATTRAAAERQSQGRLLACLADSAGDQAGEA